MSISMVILTEEQLDAFFGVATAQGLTCKYAKEVLLRVSVTRGQGF